MMGGIIPDFSTAPLYATVVLNTRDDPRLLALWCHCAIWNPIDREIGNVSKEVWVERTGFSWDTMESLAHTLIERGLLTAQGAIAWYPLQQASWDDVLPYSNELRRRDGLREMPPQQQRLEV